MSDAPAEPETETDDTTERVPSAVPRVASRVRGRSAAVTVTRLVTHWTQTLAELQRSGYVLTSQQRAALTAILDHGQASGEH